MKRIYIISTAIVLSIVFLCGCSQNKTSSYSELSTADETTKQTETTISIYDMQSEIERLKEENNGYKQLFDDRVKDVINKYAEYYLSYYISPYDNITKLKDCVTEDFYASLNSTAGYEKNSAEFEQATGILEIYSGEHNFDGSFFVLTVCSQTTIYNNEVTNSKAVYKFKIQIDDNVFKIASAEKII